MPLFAPPADSERAGLRGFLVQQLDGPRYATFGLTDAQIRLSPVRSELTLGGLLKHLTLCINGWSARAEAAPERPDFDPEVDSGGYGAEFEVGSDTLDGLLAEYAAAADRILAVVDTADLDSVAPVPNAPWFPDGMEGWSVRWILLHVIEEVARHAGHADIIREQIDGATMYELIAAAEDMGDLGFVKPWTPPSN